MEFSQYYIDTLYIHQVSQNTVARVKRLGQRLEEESRHQIKQGQSIHWIISGFLCIQYTEVSELYMTC